MKPNSLNYERDLHYAMGARAERRRIRRELTMAMSRLITLLGPGVVPPDHVRDIMAATRAPKRSLRPGKGA